MLDQLGPDRSEEFSLPNQTHLVPPTRLDRLNDFTSAAHVNLKTLSPADYPMVSHLKLEHEQEQFAGGPLSLVFSELRNSSHHELEHPFAIVVAENIVGFFVLREMEALPEWAPPGVATLHSFRVSHEHQGKGYGKAAVQLAVQWLMANRPCVRRLMLTVNLRNGASRGAYLKWGFRDTGAIFVGPIGPQNILDFTLDMR